MCNKGAVESYFVRPSTESGLMELAIVVSDSYRSWYLMGLAGGNREHR
jgi:hypothetical protein